MGAEYLSYVKSTTTFSSHILGINEQAKIAELTFFSIFSFQSLIFCFKSQWQFLWGFFWGILRFCKSKIVDSGFSHQIFFFILTLVFFDTSWGQSMSLSNLNEVSNLRWRWQLSYEKLIVWSILKLDCPETVIYHLTPLHP